MRLFALLLIFCVCTPLAAQNPIPDTTEAWRYFPLEIGNEWQYWSEGDQCQEFQVRSVVGQTLINHTRYFKYQVARFDANEDPIEPPETFFLRFDTLTATIDAADGRHPVDITDCPLNAAFGETLTCDPDLFPEAEVTGGVQDFRIGDPNSPEILETSVKWYSCCAGDIEKQFVADIGATGPQGFGCGTRMWYARVGGVEYGSPVITAAEPSAIPTHQLRLSASPNPFVGQIDLAIATPAHQSVTIDVFDLLGRRVYSKEHVAGLGETTLHLDGSNWPRGLYLVRVTTADGQTATTRITRQ